MYGLCMNQYMDMYVYCTKLNQRYYIYSKNEYFSNCVTLQVVKYLYIVSDKFERHM